MLALYHKFLFRHPWDKTVLYFRYSLDFHESRDDVSNHKILHAKGEGEVPEPGVTTRHLREHLFHWEEVCWCFKGVSFPNFQVCFYTACQGARFKALASFALLNAPQMCSCFAEYPSPSLWVWRPNATCPCLPPPLDLLSPFLAVDSSHAEPLAVPQMCQPCSCLRVFLGPSPWEHPDVCAIPTSLLPWTGLVVSLAHTSLSEIFLFVCRRMVCLSCRM